MSYSVKEYLAELATRELVNSDTSEVSEHVFSIVPQIPLTPKMMKRITGDLKKVVALHITTLKSIPKLQKMSSTARGLSTFTKFPEPRRLDFVLGTFTNAEFRDGVTDMELNFPCTLVLEGTAITSLAQDSFTYIDRSGRRWVDMQELFPHREKDKKAQFHQKIIKEQDKILKKYKKEIELDLLPLKNITWSTLQRLSGKLKSIMIREYIDAVERILTKHYKDIDMLSMDSAVGSYNEVILSKFKIKKIYFGHTYLSADEIGELNPIDIDITKEKYSKYAPIEWVGRNWKKVLTHLK